MTIADTKDFIGESPRYDESYNKKQFKSKSPQDIIKAVVELVKNGVDAYIEEKSIEKCDKEKIDIIINRNEKTIRVINYADGMDSKLFEKALAVGADTGSKKDQKTGAHGYGMKEAAWAFEKSKIVTITKKKFSSRIFYWDEHGYPKYSWDKDAKLKDIRDCTVDEEILEETGIVSQGTYFEGLLPESIKWLTFDNLLKELSWHVLLRSINQSPKFFINLIDITSKRISRRIEYHSPTIKNNPEKTPISSGEFSFKYPSYGRISCKYNIFLSDHELNSIGDSKEAGILVCAGQFSVLDCTLFENGGKIANHFFGQVTLDGPLREISKKERILDDRRISGLIKNTPLYDGLSNHFNPLLRSLVDEEVKKLHNNTKDVDKGLIDNKEKLLRELNKIAESDEILEDLGVNRFDPGETGLRFCIDGNYETLLEKQYKNIYLVADATRIPINSNIEISSDKISLLISPNKFKISKREIDKSGVFRKKISFFSEDIEEFLVTAEVISLGLQSKMNLEVIEDARLHIANPLEFIPQKQNVVEGSSKKISLIFNKDKIKADKLMFEENNLITVLDNPNIKKATNISGSIFELDISIHCNGKAGNTTTLIAKVGNASANLDLEVISFREKHLHGPFSDIKSDDQKDPAELGYFEDETKTIKVCINHPIFKYYIKNFGTNANENNPFYRVLYAETVVVEALKALTRKKIKIFSNTEAEEYRAKFDEKFNFLYKKFAVLLHNFCINYKLNSIVEE